MDLLEVLQVPTAPPPPPRAPTAQSRPVRFWGEARWNPNSDTPPHVVGTLPVGPGLLARRPQTAEAGKALNTSVPAAVRETRGRCEASKTSKPGQGHRSPNHDLTRKDSEAASAQFGGVSRQ